MQNVRVDWMDGWIPLRLLGILEQLRCIKQEHTRKGHIEIIQMSPKIEFSNKGYLLEQLSTILVPL